MVLFSRLSLHKALIYAQLLLVGGFLSVIVWFPKIFPKLSQFRERFSSFINCFPPLWFTGLQNKLLSSEDAFFTKLMHTAVAALGILLIKNPIYYIIFYIAAFIILIALKLYRYKTKEEFNFVYDEEVEPVLLCLNLDK